MNLKEKIRTIPNWPTDGVMFRDITSLLQDPVTYNHVCCAFGEHYQDTPIDKIVAVDARGFIFGAVLAFQKKAGLIPIRKAGKLPAAKISQHYSLEYSRSTLELHNDALQKGDKVLLVDDLLATGGTANAAITLIEQLGAEVIECAFVIELLNLKGRNTLKPYPVFSMIKFNDE